MSRHAIFLLIILLLLGCIVWIWRFLDIDSCLDQGYRWDHQQRVCIKSKITD